MDQLTFHLLSLFFHHMYPFFKLVYLRKPCYYYSLETMKNYDSMSSVCEDNLSPDIYSSSTFVWYFSSINLHRPCQGAVLSRRHSGCDADKQPGAGEHCRRAGSFTSSTDPQHCLHLCYVLVPREDFTPRSWSDSLQLKQSQSRLERSTSHHKLSVR